MADPKDDPKITEAYENIEERLKKIRGGDEEVETLSDMGKKAIDDPETLQSNDQKDSHADISDTPGTLKSSDPPAGEAGPADPFDPEPEPEAEMLTGADEMPAKRESTDLDELAAEDEPQMHIPKIDKSQSFQSRISNNPGSGGLSYNDPNDFHSRYSNLNKPKSSKLHLIILLLIGLAVIGGTVYLLKYQFGASEPSPSPTPVPVVVASPSPSPTPTLDRANFKVRVLNGTTKTGMAASVSAKLKDLGYQTEKTGNATNSAFQRTVVRVKTTATGLLDQLIKDLMPDYDATNSTTLKDSDAADAEVILGTK